MLHEAAVRRALWLIVVLMTCVGLLAAGGRMPAKSSGPVHGGNMTVDVVNVSWASLDPASPFTGGDEAA